MLEGQRDRLTKRIDEKKAESRNSKISAKDWARRSPPWPSRPTTDPQTAVSAKSERRFFDYERLI